MKTNNIKQFSLVSQDLIIGEVLSVEEDYLILGSAREIVLHQTDDGKQVFSFIPYYTDYLFPLNQTIHLYYNSIVIETSPETNTLVNYIAFIKDYEKRLSIKESTPYTFTSQRLH